jgi:signal peptidase II
MKKIKEFFKIKYTKSKSKIYEISIISFMIDLFIKFLVKTKLTPLKEYEIIPNFFYLTYVQNNGAAFSIFQNQQVLILLVTVFALFFINNYLKNNNINKLEMFSYSMITGGILGNLFDRLCLGYVIDFFDFRFWTYHYPVFNMADVFIVVGVILLMIYSFIEWRKEHGSKMRSK